ncbi:hypothetical protein Ndes2526B_g00777 [Nannochloris sp. 'desiccata']
MAFRTGQEKIDQLTMKISNPNVVGSGYIEHPPQRPFTDRVLVQPPTIKPEEIPDWYDSQGILHHGPRPGGAGGRGQQGYPQRGGYSTGRGYQPGQRQSGGSGVPGYHGPAAPRPQHQHHQQPRPQDHQPRPAVQPGVFDTSTLMHSLQQQQQRPPAPVAPAAAPRPAAPAPPAPRPAPVPVGAEPEEEKKLSKSAKAKLRKKMREAKA